MKYKNSNKELEVFHKIVAGLSSLEKDVQTRIIQSVVTFLEIENVRVVGHLRGTERVIQIASGTVGKQTEAVFSDREEMTPKQFMLEKQPRTDVERVACLAYYLTHYRGTSQFKTIDLSKLNTEAAQRKFSNAALTAKNAVKTRYFVQASKKGHRQLSADGEQIIAALPDREEVATIRKRIHPHRTTKRSYRRKTKVASK